MTTAEWQAYLGAVGDTAREQQARSVKAYKMARLAVCALRTADRGIEVLESADEQARAKLCELAHVRSASDATWEVMLGLVREMLRDGTGPKALPQ